MDNSAIPETQPASEVKTEVGPQIRAGNLAAQGLTPAEELKRQALLLMFPTTIFVLVPCLVAAIGSLFILGLCPDTNASMTMCQPDNQPSWLVVAIYASIAILAMVSIIGVGMLKRWAIILNAIVVAGVVCRVVLWILAWTYKHVIVSGKIGLDFDFSSVFAVLSLAVVFIFVGFVMLYPCLMYYRHVAKRSFWLFDAIARINQSQNTQANHP